MRDEPQDTSAVVQVQYDERTQTSIINVDVEWRWNGGDSPSSPRRPNRGGVVAACVPNADVGPTVFLPKTSCIMGQRGIAFRLVMATM
jgi:hypothetical protein